MKKVKKLLTIVLILIMLITPNASILAATYEGNVAGSKLPSGSGGGGTANPAYNCVYILGLAESYGIYGLRITFYLENGAQTGNTIDVWRWDTDERKQNGVKSHIGKKQSGTDANGFSKWKIDKETRATNSLTKIDYIKGAKFQVMNTSYTYYYDDVAPTYTTPITKVKDPLNYLSVSDRSAFKEYFTTPEVVERYAKLAGANIDVQDGKYNILLEPMLKLSRMPCPQASHNYSGRYTATELGILWKENIANTIQNNTLRKMIFKGLFLESEGSVGEYTFKLDPGIDVDHINGVQYKHITGQYGYGMGIINGSEVCKTNCTSVKKYKIIYHAIDLSSPFLNENGDIRKISNDSNWCKEPNSASTTCKTTFGVDSSVYSKTPFLTVVLTPSSISKIKKDNKNINYTKITNYTCTNFWQKFKNNSMFSPNTNFCG